MVAVVVVVCVCGVSVCSDRDECRENKSTCPVDSICVNINSSFFCHCRHDNHYYHQPTRSCRGLYS